jgi:hypothetical protein
VFDLDDFGVTGPFTTEKVSMGVLLVDADGGQIDVTVKLHTLNGQLLVGNLTELASTQIQLGNQNETNVDVPLVTEVPAGSTLVAEVFCDDLNDTGLGFIIGGNEGGQTDQAYIRAPSCNFPEPITTGAAGQPNTAIILTVSGMH